MIAPLGRAFSPQDIGLNDSIDSDVDVLTGRSALYSLNSGSLLEDISAGLFETSAISGRMWDDVNANGIQDPSEVGGVDGAIVQLLDASNSVIASTISSGGGLYSFNNLAPGQYRVQYEQVDPNKSFTYKDVGPDDNIDSDADSSGRTDLFTLAAGEVKDNLDAGAWFAATITDSYVWHDLNGDGLNNGEPGLGGVTVRLYRNTDTGPVLEGTQITDPTGFFEFSNVIPGDSFFLEFTGPAGFEITEKDVGINDAIDSDADPLTGETNNFSLLSEAVLSNQEAGFFQRSSIESTVWNDLNGNGIRDAGEPGLAGITVNLRDASGIIATTVSAADGSYAFLNLVPGEYFIEAVAPTGFVNSPMDVGIDDTVDSDPDEITGITDAILIESGSGPLNDIDAGIYEKNLAPTDIEMPNRTVGDFSENGDLVSELFATDPNVNDTHTFFFKHSNGTLSTIDEDGRFEIVGNEIRVLDASQIDRSVEPYHEVTIVAVDSGIGNLSYMETFRIDVLTIGDDLTALDDVKTQLKAPEYELHIPKRHVTHPDWLFDYEFEEVDYDPNIVDPYVIPVVERVRNWLDDMANVLGF
ncbi:MAG: hypothetical protein CMO81_01770 [Waddliaceae bacterium]|nr:hypothetical protein [Waddliaceae bacterium]